MAEETGKTPGKANKLPEKPDVKMKRSATDLWKSTTEFFHDLVDLKDGMDREGTIVNIKNNKTMVGAQAWLLMCSIMIASLGLDLNSPAVIIGAMLISPLMSPILGVGLGIGMNDRQTLFIALKHFGISIGIAIFTSTLYFVLTPFGNETQEILSRTKPTLLDVLVAFFGGVAGIISGSRKDKSNAIPGVAIATALMPPLCVTGFGIANLEWKIMANSFYLFFLNATFVALATFLVVRLLDFPQKKFKDEREKIRTTWAIVMFSIVLILPSTYILYQLLQENRENTKIDTFLTSTFGENLDDFKKINRDTCTHLIVKVFGDGNDYKTSKDYENAMKEFGINNCTMDLVPTYEIDLDDYSTLKDKVAGVNTEFENRLAVINETNSVKEREVEALTNIIDSLKRDSIPLYDISKEAKILFPDLKKIGFAKSETIDFKKQQKLETPMLLVSWARKPGRSTEAKLKNFVIERANLDTLVVVNY